jgi:long-subunit acyl-CoA synthetase (AMP-forming)
MDLHRLADRLLELPDEGISFYENGRPVRKSYPEVRADMDLLRSRLTAIGVEPAMRIGIMAENCYDWIVFELALLSLRAVLIAFPVEEFAEESADALAEKYALQLLVVSAGRQKRMESREWVALLKINDDSPLRLRHPVSGKDAGNGNDFSSLDSDVFTLVFSSGTSGKIKCLLISKDGTEEIVTAWGRGYRFKPDDGILVVLPLSNYQQRMMVYTAVWHGFSLILTDPLRLFQALKEMHPTILAGPPLFYEITENRFRNLPTRKRVLLTGLGRMIQLIPVGSIRGPMQRRCFAAFHNAFGGKIRLMLTGSAPIRRSTLDLFALVGLPLYEVYALTEFGFVSWNLPGANRPGSVGRPMFEDSVQIADDGEIIVSHEPLLSRGYFDADPEEEQKTFLSSSRIATGDMGRFDEDGYLHILGRKKQIIITQGGYKIQAETIEKRIEIAGDVARAVVFGGGELSTLVALVSLREESNARAEKTVQSVIDQMNQTLPAPSRIGRVVFTQVQFRPDNGFLTRNLKLDRGAIYQSFHDALIGIE